MGDQIIEALMLHQRKWRPTGPGLSRADARTITVELFQDVGVSMPGERVDAYAWQLSGGLRQRAMIAMALSCRPRLLIADEPTTALDVTTQAQILNLLRDLQRRHGTAIVFITHDLGVIAQIAHSVVVMYLGRVMEHGPVDDIFHAPKHPYTRVAAPLDPEPAGHAAVAAAHHRRLDPAPARPARRLRLPPALPRRDRRPLRPAHARAARGRAHAVRGVLPLSPRRGPSRDARPSSTCAACRSSSRSVAASAGASWPRCARSTT